MPSGVKDIQLLELKDTISQLNKTISTQNELISSLQKMLEERNAKDSEKDLLIANLQSQLAYLKNKVFGSTSEIRHDQLDGQLNLFGTPVGDEKPAEVIEPEVISVKGYTKERKPKATYDDKYNSVRSICKHFFTDIVGLSIKFFCVSLRHMSIKWRVKTRIDPQGVTAQGFYVVQFFYDAGDIANAVTIGVVKALGINFIKYSVVQPGSGHVPFRPFHSLCSACCQFHYSTGRDICLSFLKRPGPFCKGPYLYSRSGNRNLLQRQGIVKGNAEGSE